MENNNAHKIVDRLLADNRILDALTYVKANGARDIVSQTGNSYRYMLEYFAHSNRNIEDPSRSDVVSKMREDLRRAADAIDVRRIKKEAQGSFFSTMRILSLHPENNILNSLNETEKFAEQLDMLAEANETNAEINIKLEEAAAHLFENVWTELFLTEAEYRTLNFFLLEFDSKSAFQSKALVLAALLLSSLKYYDYRKFKLLLLVCMGSNDNRLQARALVGALLILAKYPDRIKEDQSILAIASSLGEDEKLSQAVRKFVPGMLRTIDTDRVNKRVKDEIIPELMRMKPDIEKSLKRMGGKGDIYDIEENPDWEDILKKSGVTDKLKELTEMQMDGADIFMSAFAQMKGFPFFRKLSNWLLPFDINHSELRNIRGVVPMQLLKFLTVGQYFCASDKYSMVLALSKMPPEQFKMMSSQLSAQMDAINQEVDSSMLPSAANTATEIVLYLKDLYRFFKLKNDDDSDPFSQIFEIPDIAPYTPLHSDVELQRNIAEFYFKYGYWQQAYDSFENVLSLSSDTPEDVLQKQGYCLQLLGKDAQALEVYKKAELLNSESDWLLKRMATLLRAMKRYAESAEYTRRALERKPDNLSLEMLLATTLMLNGDAEAALKSFYKIRYLKPENKKILRPIAWCEFLLGNYDKSIKQYEVLSDISATDMLNCGHALFAKGNNAAALSRYKACVRTLSGGAKEFRKLYNEDKEYLMNTGITELDIALMADLATSNSDELHL
ncbi:MAG: hypothetical protein NC402_00655 [Prevotella sp.]|nr:hypothetical protein [Prevotella sp.]MCM1074717.1 hypothetical protein [Ruminococcus sp.]